MHRLVAQIFLPNPRRKEQVNHIDGNPVNNYCGSMKNDYLDSNLEWETRVENMRHASLMGLLNTKSPKRKAQCKKNREKVDYTKIKKPVYQIDTAGKIIAEYPSIVAASQENKIPASNIGEVARKEKYRMTAGGYVWVFVDEHDKHNDYAVKKDQQKSTRKQVLQYTQAGTLVREYASIKEACRYNNWSRGDYIGMCCNGKKKHYKGYVWAFKK